MYGESAKRKEAVSSQNNTKMFYTRSVLSKEIKILIY